MTNNERISQRKEMMSKALKRIDNTVEKLRQSGQQQQMLQEMRHPMSGSR
ncbi:hypothetical protein [uncultured Hymenobacter sp.]